MKKQKIVLDYIGKHNIGEHDREDVYVLDEFSLFARILEIKEDTVIYERYMKFGKIKIGQIEISKEEFTHYYQKANSNEIITLYI